MNHTSLEIFSVVAEELSVVKAAKRLGRVQSNITTRIQQLEEELDVALFIRENKRLKLSPQGRQFLGYARKLLSLAEEARQSLHPQPQISSLNIGSMECAAASRLALPLAQFNQQHPQVSVTLTTQPTRQLTEGVLAGTWDCALVALPTDDRGQVQCPAGLEMQLLFDEALQLVLPASMNRVTSPEEIGEGRLAAFMPGCTYRQIALDLLPRMAGEGRQIEIQPVMSYHSMLACVAAGSAMCLLPESVLQLLQLPAGLTTLPAGQATTQLIWRSDYQSPALESLKHLLLESVAN